MSASGLWREPASLLPLRWGAYRPRLVAGIAMIMTGSACVLATTAYSLPFLLAGSLLQLAGWAVLPATLGRRVAVPLPVLRFSWLMLGGAQFAWCYAVPLAAWLLVRIRPLPSYAALAVPVATSLVLPLVVSHYGQGWIIILTMSLAVIGAAWLARLISREADSWQSARPHRK
ncbi:hypothetical protein ATY41_00410 [Leifsonia xyli subsp. xyli]|uniref:Uncharacterized protein n=2 Tax=Leifsonia xyli subsp. xyli TaxID=59736 RepID=Q6AD53_LEIXX|nr:hypothetical protein [Leifsonia xyli]AAT89691.1 hypothetical protein Lxx19760 [Leifsonia xyli subsp. xyli str. CTCB07]ODA91205.1 hypothetical protein ATY41_00410 [Leifsonia xyli subsp. xyli]